MMMLPFLLTALFATVSQPHMVVTTDWLGANLNHPGIRLLDVTTAGDYNRGHIQGAVFLNVNALMVRRDDIPNELPPVAELEELFRQAGVRGTDRIILTSKDPLLAARAWFTLDYLGWGDRAAILDGGNAKWIVEKRPIEMLSPAVEPGDFTALIDPHTLISRDQLKALLQSNQPMVLLDARADPRQYLGEVKGAEVRRAGHIRTAECMPWTANTVVKNQGVYELRSAAELERIYASRNITTQIPRLVVYCRTGTEASMTYFVLRYLGFHPALYDGSFVEWSKTESVASAER